MEAIKKILRTPSAFVLFLVAVVSLIGVIIKSETDKAIARMPIDATSTAEARLTEVSNLTTITHLAILPSTDTPLLAPTVPPPLPTNTPIQSPANTTVPSAPQATPLPPVITIFKNGDRVTRNIDVFGSVAQSALEQGTYLNIIVFVDGSATYYVQAIPEIQADGTWRSSPVYIGTVGSADTGKTFHICAVLLSQQLHPGEISSFPTGSKSCVNVIRE